jgi:hypothetical protein
MTRSLGTFLLLAMSGNFVLAQQNAAVNRSQIGNRSPLERYGPPPTNEPLLNSKIVVMKGVVIPSRKINLNGSDYTVPLGCEFTFVLPPGQKALGSRRLGEPVFDKTNNTCEAAFEVGIPARFANTRQPKAEEAAVAQMAITSSGYSRAWWTDPIGLTVTWAAAGIDWSWGEGQTCAEYLDGAYSDWGYSGTYWVKVDETDNQPLIRCEGVSYIGGSVWMNNVFPPCSVTNPMFLAYDVVRATGEADGYLFCSMYTYTSGGECRFLLTPHHECIRTMN